MATVTSFDHDNFVELKGRGGTVIRPRTQAEEVKFVSTVATVPIPDVPTNGLSNGSQMFRAVLRANTLPGIINGVTISLQVTLASACVLAPVQHWWQSIVVRIDGTDTPLCTIYPEQLIASLFAAGEDQMKPLLKQTAWNTEDNALYGTDRPYVAGTYKFDLPLTGLFFNKGIFLKGIQSDLVFEFNPLGTGPLVSGTLADVSLTGLKILIETRTLAPAEEDVYRLQMLKAPVAYRFIQFQNVLFPATTLTAQTLTQLTLESLRGSYGGINVWIRAAGSTNTNNALTQWIDLGGDAHPGSSLDIVTAEGRSFYGRGTSVSSRFFRQQLYSESFRNSLAMRKAVLLMPFSDVMSAALDGQKSHGFFEIKAGDRWYLNITPSAAHVAKVDTISCSGIPASGFYKLGWEGSYTQALAWDTTAANMAAAFNALDTVKRDGLTVAFSAAMGNGITATFTSTNGRFRQLIDVSSVSLLTGAGAPIGVTVAQTTGGNGGFTTGNYDIVLSAWKFRDLYLTEGGTRLNVLDA